MEKQKGTTSGRILSNKKMSPAKRPKRRARKASTRVYIGDDVYLDLPEEEQEKFELCARYKDEDKDDEWFTDRDDDVFTGTEDFFNFWGYEDSCDATGSVYFRRYEGELTEEQTKYFTDLASKEHGNQLRIF